MYKADGTPIRNPQAYVNARGQSFQEQLFTADGQEIRNPKAFVAAQEERGTAMNGRSNNSNRPIGQFGSSKDGDGARNGYYTKGNGKAFASKNRGSARVNGTTRQASLALPSISAPAPMIGGNKRKTPDTVDESRPAKKQSVARATFGAVSRNEVETESFTSDRPLSKNPTRYSAMNEKNGHNKPLYNRGQNARGQGPSSNEGIMFLADGTPIRNPQAYIQSIEVSGSKKVVYTADGEAIRNPVKFLQKYLAREHSGDKISSGTSCSSTAGNKSLFTAEGTLVKNPWAFLEKMQRTGNSKPVYTANGDEIRNLEKFIRTNFVRDKTFDGDSSYKSGVADGNGAFMFMADGRPIRNPQAFVAKIDMNSYNSPVFTASGEEIRDPKKFVEKRIGRQGRSAPVDESAHFEIYSADGNPIDNLDAVVAGIEQRGYSEPVYTKSGDEIRDPIAYIRRQRQRAIKPVRQKSKKVPKVPRLPTRRTVSTYGSNKRVGRSTKQKANPPTLGRKLRVAASRRGGRVRKKRSSAQ